MLYQVLTVPLNIFTPMRTRLIRCGILLSISMFAICGGLSAQSCGGRPSERDVLSVRDLVAEQITEQHFWFGEGASIPSSQAEVTIRIASTPVANEDGANILVIVPAAGTVSLWRVCAQDFAFVSAYLYPHSMTTADLEKVKEQHGQFFQGTASTGVTLTVQIKEAPDFDGMSEWKASQLVKIKRALICFLSSSAGLPQGQTLQLRVGNFTQRSLKVPVEVPERDAMWIMTFRLDASGMPSTAVVGTVDRLQNASSVLKNQLQNHSFSISVASSPDLCGK
jgi:hypothetical protein